MKTREAFDLIRNKKIKLSLRTRMTIYVAAEQFSCLLIALGLAFLLYYVTNIDSLFIMFVITLIFCLLIGAIVTIFTSKWFFDPIKKLRVAMGKVADGDFSVYLKTKSSSKEIQEVYSGFNLMLDELTSTEILQSDFVSNVSHEFKTPINAIEGYTTLLQGCDNLDEEHRQYVEKILFNTKRLSTLVGNVLLLSKIENQEIQTNQTTFRLDEQIRQSIVALEPAWTSKDMDLDVDLENITYTGSETLLHHVWDNLIGNAIKFSPELGLVKISLKRKDNSILFSVADNGPGLSEEAMKHIFDKFYQADSTRKEEGNGLGLALVKRILSIVEGDISAENLPEGGCRFVVKLK